MVLPKKEGGLGVRNIKRVVNIKRAAKLWSPGPFIPKTWMKDKYIKNQMLEAIQIGPTIDSALWKHRLAQRQEISEILDCGMNNRTD